jgi:hypothetical protein
MCSGVMETFCSPLENEFVKDQSSVSLGSHHEKVNRKKIQLQPDKNAPESPVKADTIKGHQRVLERGRAFIFYIIK